MADYAIERLNIPAARWTAQERAALGADLLRYAALQINAETPVV